MDDDSQAVSRAISSLDSAKGMNPISNPLGTRDVSLSQTNENAKFKLSENAQEVSNPYYSDYQ